jgi:hypothetical protein
MAVPDDSAWGVINSGDTAPVAAEVSGVLHMVQHKSPWQNLSVRPAAER